MTMPTMLWMMTYSKREGAMKEQSNTITIWQKNAVREPKKVLMRMVMIPMGTR